MSDTGLPATPPPGAPSEPLAKVGGATAAVTAVTAVIALLVAFGLDLTHAQVIAILGVIAVAAPIVTAVWGRLKVWSPRSVRALALQVRADERGRHAAKDTSEADVRDVRPGWLPPNLDPR